MEQQPRKAISIEIYRQRKNTATETQQTASIQSQFPKKRGGKNNRHKKQIKELKRILETCCKVKDKTNIEAKICTARTRTKN